MPDEIRMLEIRDSVLSEAAFNKISRASNTVNQIIQSLQDKENKYPRLHCVQKDIYYTKDLITPIAKVFNAKGEISDKASHALNNIREEMTGLRRKTSHSFHKVMKDLQAKGMLADILTALEHTVSYDSQRFYII